MVVVKSSDDVSPLVGEIGEEVPIVLPAYRVSVIVAGSKVVVVRVISQQLHTVEYPITSQAGA